MTTAQTMITTQQFDEVVENPTYMLIGEAWGKEEAAQQLPFVGRSGIQLTRLLQGAKIDRGDCYILNIMNERPPKNDFGTYYEDKKRKKPTQKLKDGWAEVLAKVAFIRPKVVVPLGDEPLKVFLGVDHQGIECHQGSIYYGDAGIPIVPTFHPSAVIRGGGKSAWYFPITIMNFKRIRSVAKSYVKPFWPEVQILSLKELESYAEQLIQKKALTSFDIEVSYEGTGERITCISFAQSVTKAYVVSFLDVTEDYVESMAKINAIKKILESPNVTKIGQNAYNFDIPTLKRVWGIDVKNYVMDTMFAHMGLHPEYPHDLGFLVSQYTLIPYYKHFAETDILRYNGLDSAGTMGASKGIVGEMEKRKIWERYKTFWHRMLRPLRGMAVRGICIDKEYQEVLRNELQEEITQRQSELNRLYESYTDKVPALRRLYRWELLHFFGRKTVKLPNGKGKISRKRVESAVKHTQTRIQKLKELNVQSTQQLAHFLYGILGLPRKTRRGKVTTDKTALNQLYIKTQHKFLKTMLKLRTLEDQMSDYGKLATDEQGRVRTTYKMGETGRLTSGKFEAK